MSERRRLDDSRGEPFGNVFEFTLYRVPFVGRVVVAQFVNEPRHIVRAPCTQRDNHVRVADIDVVVLGSQRDQFVFGRDPGRRFGVGTERARLSHAAQSSRDCQKPHSGRRYDGFEPRAEFQRRSRGGFGAHEHGAEACPKHARRLVGSLNHDMSQLKPRTQETAASPTAAQTHCRDCPHARGHHSAERAQTDAHDHADITGHTVEVEADQFSRPLVVVGELEVGE